LSQDIGVAIQKLLEAWITTGHYQFKPLNNSNNYVYLLL
jgi:hypothetical protein